MPRRFLPIVTAALFAALSVAPGVRVRAAGGAADRPGGATFEAFAETHCADCHSGAFAEADFRLDDLSGDLHDPAAAAAWAKALGRVERGEMPPADYGAPPEDETAAAVASLRAGLTAADGRRRDLYGRAGLRRLSRAEFANSLKDLLHQPELDLAGMLPPDGREAGFAKSAAALDFSHVTVSQYLDVADFALREALADSAEPAPRRAVRAELKSVKGLDAVPTFRIQMKHTSAIPLVGTEIDPTLETYRGDFKTRTPGYIKDPAPHFDGLVTFMNHRHNHGVAFKPFKVPQDGEYVLRVHGWGVYNDYGVLKPGERTETVAFYEPTGRLLGRCDLPPDVPTTAECRVRLRAGVPIEFLAVSIPNGDGRQFDKKDDPVWQKFARHGLALQWFELEGPLPPEGSGLSEAPWPPAGHRALLGDLPLEPVAADAGGNGGRKKNEPAVDPVSGLPYRVATDDPEADADRLLTAFADRALRRPPTAEDLAVPRAQIAAALADGQPFVEAMLAGYRALLTSPAFLLRSEEPGPLDGHAVASRLSFFLWDGPPDAELKAAAESGDLLTDAGLRRQTDRLLNDPRAERFVTHFLDDWLALSDIRLTEPDENLYPEHTALLTESMVEETRAFFAAMIADDLGVSHVYDSDFLTINQRLAEAYGIGGVRGSQIRRVPIPSDHVRGGLLTQGSLLKVTANGTTTSPVVRGVFVMDRLLGDPPPPPPPNVPAIEPDLSGATTVRELLDAHRADPACAGCHRKIDPPGFALESFDVTGGYRDRYRVLREDADRLRKRGKLPYAEGPAVESFGDLPGAGPFEDVNGFRDRLRGMDRQIAANLLRRLVLYATGGPVSFADEAEFAALLDELEPGGFGTRSMIHAVVRSEMFRRK
ncbi:DUF1592 domain-containing protein [Alienimonas sp. DA493]|uniref:DUF1592 domain-containing protein n=1 Tax=Alienimonas sp. DA493 TaxID=3373605 RepID=UPI0037553127